MDKSLDIDMIQNNPNMKIIITIPNERGVTGFIVQETFKINGEAVYESLFEQGLLSEIPVAGRLAEKLKKFGGITLKNKNETTLAWMQSRKPKFSVELLFIATKSSHDPRQDMIRLLEGTFPVKGGKGTVMHPPWNYKKFETGASGGKIMVQIGKWFLASNQVLTNVDFDISTQVIKSGKPLYCQGSINFEPYQDVFASDISSYFP